MAFLTRAGLTLLALNLAAGPLLSERASEYAVRAAFLANFFSYVQWPDRAGTEPTICVLGRDPFGLVLETTIREYRGDGVHVRRLGEGQSARHCSILYIAAPAPKRVDAILEGAAQEGILTVGENDEFLRAGGILALEAYDDNKRIRIAVNLDRATSNRFKISSRLLAMSRVVRASNGGRR